MRACCAAEWYATELSKYEICPESNVHQLWTLSTVFASPKDRLNVPVRYRTRAGKHAAVYHCVCGHCSNLSKLARHPMSVWLEPTLLWPLDSYILPF